MNIVRSDMSRINAKLGTMMNYNPLYEHKGNYLTADSGYLYKNEIGQEFFEAFGNVVITQPSGTLIYADHLHYDASAQLAKLTGNVKMEDRNSVLTTNYLTYNLRSKIGTYTGGGRIISQNDTITSRNAYYFENTGDAYFRHKVVVRTPSVKVFTDTMRYNGITKNTYFFGPTNIKGNKNENLYTERGVYNTATGVAYFNKENLYTEGSKFLKSDSLYYDRASGVGQAFRNVVFVDTLDKFYAYGGKGVYKSEDESILMTDKPYIVTVIKNEQDSTAQDTLQQANPIEKPVVNKKDSKKGDNNKKNGKEKKIEEHSLTEENSEITDESKEIKVEAKVDSVYLTADTLFSKMILVKDYKPLNLNLDRNGGQVLEDADEDYGDEDDINTPPATQEGTPIEDKGSAAAEVKPTQAPVTKTTPKPVGKPPILNPDEDRKHIAHTLKADSILRQQAEIPKEGHADSVINEALRVAQKEDTTPKVKDSTYTVSDTARTRIVKAYYNVRLYKSDLQAVADSAFYAMQDSMFRFMGRPMIWAEDSQISADTIYMQIVNQQLDNAVLVNNAFMVNAVADSTKFNQLKGRRITAFFKNNNIEKLFVDGNAENLVFSVNERTNRIMEMFHDRGARIKVTLENRKIIDYITIKNIDQKVYPVTMINAENEVLPGFIWRPQDRPKSKEDLLNRKRELPKDEEKTETKENNIETEESSDEG